MTAAIDLNADVGEECGDDVALLGVVTTANVACGGHAGGGEVLAATVAAAVSRGVAVGAHPSYPDRAGFGRISLAGRMSPDELAQAVAEQVMAGARECAVHGAALSHVKAHGALYNDAAANDVVAFAFLDGVDRARGLIGEAFLPVMGLPGSALARAAALAGVPYIDEAFADRAYRADGSLLPRGQAGAVLLDPDAIARQAVLIATRHHVIDAEGTVIPVSATTVCLHGDNPGALASARAVRAALERQGVEIAAPARASR